MNKSTPHARYPACRPANPVDCARCALSYECRANANEGIAVPWPLVALVVFGVAGAMSFLF